MKICSPCTHHLGNTTDKATAGCLSGIFRRLRCGSLANVSSNVAEESTYAGGSSPFEDEEAKERIEVPSPNLVARLMGLESMPEFDWVPRTPNAIGRSRSANSIQNLIDLDPSRSGRRRLKSSASFREIPTFLQLENEDFLLLSFGYEDRGEGSVRTEASGGGGIEESRVSTSGRKSRGKIESPGKKKKKTMTTTTTTTDQQTGSGKEKLPEKTSEDRASRRDARNREIKKDSEKFRKPALVLIPENPLESTTVEPVTPQKTKSRMKRRTKAPADKKSDGECSSTSENSSPVSVLDHAFEVDRNSVLSEEDSSPTKKNSRRQSSRSRTSLRSLHQSSLVHERIPKPAQNEVKELKRLDCELPNLLSDLCSEMYRLVEEDIKKTNWVFKEKREGEDFEEIGIQISLQVFDSLLHEVLTELSVVRSHL